MALLGLAVALFGAEQRAPEPPPGDRTRRARRKLGALLMGMLAVGLVGWEFIDARREPVLFVNVSAVLLLLVAALVILALRDFGAVSAAARHRKLAILTQEIYGLKLRELEGREAERIGREAIERMIKQREQDGDGPGEGER